GEGARGVPAHERQRRREPSQGGERAAGRGRHLGGGRRGRRRGHGGPVSAAASWGEFTPPRKQGGPGARQGVLPVPAGARKKQFNTPVDVTTRAATGRPSRGPEQVSRRGRGREQ